MCFYVICDFGSRLGNSRRHGKRQIKHFDFGIEYKPNGRTYQFLYQWLELFCLLEEMYIKARVAFLKSFSIGLTFDAYYMLVGVLTIISFVQDMSSC